MHQGKNMYISKIRTSKEVLGVPFKGKTASDCVLRLKLQRLQYKLVVLINCL